jgi:F420 biosynthesis protein FbiB-like protein
MKIEQVSSPVLDAIQHRRSIRRYRRERVPREVIQGILEAAMWAPSAHNRQPWRFAVIERQSQKEFLAREMGARLRGDLRADGVPEAVIEQDAGRSYERITAAPLLIAICLSMADMDSYPDERRSRAEYLMAVQSAAMAGQNLLLAAHDAGLGACWMCAPLFCPDVVRSALDLPDDWQPQALLTVGYPAERREKTREPIETKVVWR